MKPPPEEVADPDGASALVRRSWVGQHAMRGRNGVTLKLRFPDGPAARVEAGRLNALQGLDNPLRPYPCGWTDEGEWHDVADHWHNGRDRARRS